MLSCPHLWQIYKSSPPSAIGHSHPQLSQITSVFVTTSFTKAEGVTKCVCLNILSNAAAINPPGKAAIPTKPIVFNSSFS